MNARAGAPRVLHIHGSFAADRPLARRSAQLIDAFGGRLSHWIVSASGDFTAAEGCAKAVKIQRLSEFPPLGGLPLPGRLQRIARALQDYDLILTYGRSAMDVALAHTMFSKVHTLPPLIHHEDGSDETVRQRRGLRSKWYRRVGLGKAVGLVVATETMEHVALIGWQQPLGRVKTIRDGIELKRFTRPAEPDAIPRLLKRPGEKWVGCFASPACGSDLLTIVKGMARLGPEWHLVIVGQPPAATTLMEQRLEHRVHVAPAATDHAAAMRLFDIVAVPRGAEILPLAAIEAMAAARPVVAFDRGETARALSADNCDLLMSETPEAALERLAGDRYLRDTLGAANRERAGAERDEVTMIAAYRRLYSSAIGRDAI